MADQNIKINIGTSYNGAGMQKVTSATNQLSRVAGKSASAVGQIGQAFDTVNGKAGKAVGAIASFAGAFATGGPIGLAIAGVTMLIGKIQKHNEELEETRKEFQKLELERLTASIKAYGDEALIAAGKLNKLATAQNALAKARSMTLQLRAENEAREILQGAEKGTDEEKGQARIQATQITQDAKVEAAKVGLSTAENTSSTATENLKEVTKKLDGLKAREASVYAEYKKLLGNAYSQKTFKDQTAGKKEAENFLENYKKEIKNLEAEQEKYRTQIDLAANEINTQRELVKKAEAEREEAMRKVTKEVEDAAMGFSDFRKRMEQSGDQWAKDHPNGVSTEDKQFQMAQGQAYLDELKKKEEQENEAKEQQAGEAEFLARKTKQDQVELLMQQLVTIAERMRKTNATDTQQLKDLDVQRQQVTQHIADLLGMTNEEIKKKNLAVAVNVDAGGQQPPPNGDGGGSLFDEPGAGQPNGGFMPWERNRGIGPAANNQDNPNRMTRGEIRRHAKTHRKQWLERGWDPDSGKPLAEEKKQQVNLADQTINKLKDVIKDAQKPHVAH